jgi:haloacetate dehalogenase
MWARAGKAFSLGAYHWFLFAQPYDLPERLLSADPDYFLDWTFGRWRRIPAVCRTRPWPPIARHFADPKSGMRWCRITGPGRRSTTSLADRAAGRVLDCPVLVLCEQGRFERKETPLTIWQAWASQVEGRAIPGGHLQPEEQPGAVLDVVGPFLAQPCVDC